MVQRPWIAFFSQTGSEIVNISQALGRWPDLIITNKRPERLRKINEKLLEREIITLPNKPIQGDYFDILQYYPDALITLHGWLRVVPESIANDFEIYNGHPGLITLYPDLKGKDPQVKAWEANYKTVGSVIHRVTAGVDEGPVVMERAFTFENLPMLSTMYEVLHNISTELWIKFFREGV